MAVIDVDSFGRYGPVGSRLANGNYSTTSFLPNTYVPGYSGVTLTGSASYIGIIEGRFPGSTALRINHSSATGSCSIRKTLPGNYGRVLWGGAIRPDGVGVAAITFFEGATAHWTVMFNSSGNIEVRRGIYTATLVATSSQAYAVGSWHYVEIDITFSNTVGACSVIVNGVASSIALTSTDTCASSNEYANVVQYLNQHSTASVADFADVYIFDTTGGENNSLRGDTRVENLVAVSDDSTQFLFAAGVLGDSAVRLQLDTLTAPGDNQLVLRKFTTGPACTLDSVGILSATTSAGAKNKAVLYNDNGSGTAPSGAAVAVGTEVTGLTDNTATTLPFSAGQSLSASTVYWIGYITDTSAALWASDSNQEGYKASNTYASGAPSSPSMTGNQPSWCIWGNVSGISGANYSAIDAGYSNGDFSYIKSNTISNTDIFNLANLSSVPDTIGGIKISAIARKTDAATRTIDLLAKSGSSTATGSTATIPLSTSYSDLSTFVVTDPATGSAWTESGINSAKVGVKVKS